LRLRGQSSRCVPSITVGVWCQTKKPWNVVIKLWTGKTNAGLECLDGDYGPTCRTPAISRGECTGRTTIGDDHPLLVSQLSQTSISLGHSAPPGSELRIGDGVRLLGIAQGGL
jgi:hypothetical protein